MGPEVVNKNRNCVFNGPYAGRDLYITMFQDSEREFVVTHNANIKPVSYFTGRETELRELRKRIEEGRKSVLVSGMGGIGKTHICRKLFEEYLAKHNKGENEPFQHIGYVEYDGDMGSSLQRCLKFKKQDSPEQNQEAAWKELEHLAADGKLLLFVDNVDKTMAADSGLQKLDEIPGAIVLTSRRASFGDGFEICPIGFLETEECGMIYEKIRFKGSGREVGTEEIHDLEYIIENLAGRHTITIEFLAHLAYTKHWAVKRLREELEQKGFRLEFHKNGELINIHESFEVLYDLSGLTEAEQNILEAFSIFPYIPLSAETCDEWLLADAGVDEDADILVGLYEKGWLQFDINHESYALHPVFSQFIYEKCRPKMESHLGLIRECCNSLKIPGNGFVLKCKKHMPFAENIAIKIDMKKDIQSVLFIGFLASLLKDVSEYKKAQGLYRECLGICEKVYGKFHVNTAVIYNKLAEVYERQGKYKEAEGLNKKSLWIKAISMGTGNLDMAVNYDGLAAVYVGQGKYKKAETMYKKSLRIKEKVLGAEHLLTAAGYNNLAGVYADQRKYGEAEALYGKSLRIKERVLGVEHPDTAVCYNNLAGVYMDQGKYAEAERVCEKGLRIRAEKLRADHPDVAVSYHMLADIYAKRGECEKAEPLYEKSLRIKERALGAECPSTAICYVMLGWQICMQFKESIKWQQPIAF